MTPQVFEQKSVERALGERSRYRYVNPRVRRVENGFRIESPCCSRKVDAAGGVVDIAWIQRRARGGWSLHRKNHQTGNWELFEQYETLAELLTVLKLDPARQFWQ